MNELVLISESNLRRVFVEALIEYSERLQTIERQAESKPKKKLHSIKELAEHLGVSIPTAQKYKNEGLPCFQYRRSVIFDPDEVLQWMRSQKNSRKK